MYMNIRTTWLPPILLIASSIFLYAGFLHNPLIFDDISFFGNTTSYLGSLNFSVAPRSLSYFTFTLTNHYAGFNIALLRVESLALHASVGITLYFFLNRLWEYLLPQASVNTISYQWLAFFAAVIFILHPAAVYGSAYLVERSIVMSALFTLLMWLSVLRGLKHNNAIWLWASVIFYALALLSKEHAIMAPGVSIAIALLWWRTKSAGSIKPPLVKHLISVLISYTLIGIYTILLLKGIIGKTYEIQGVDMASRLQLINQESIYQLSILNQSALFFKYIGLWLFPNPLWMSIDIRIPFVTTFFAWPQTLGFIAFVLYPIAGSALLWRGGRLGILGFALLAPWLMYATEISTVRIQEPFVLYRSYLWFAPAFASFAIIFSQIQKRRAIIILISISVLMYPLAFDRLRTFSHPFMLWDDAARLMEGKSGLPGLERIYVKYGNQLRKAGLADMAITEQTKAINIRNDFIYAYNERGLAYLDLKQYQNALNDFNKTITIIYNNGKPYPGQQLAVKILAEAYMGRGTSLEFLNQKALASRSIDSACNLGLQEACNKKAYILPLPTPTPDRTQ
jgi:tetratricopeptide (TPR) repeat protein